MGASQTRGVPNFFVIKDDLKLTRSQRTGRIYNELESIYIVNPAQAYEYINHDAILYDIFPGRDRRLVFVFNRNEVQPLWDKWCNHELN